MVDHILQNKSIKLIYTNNNYDYTFLENFKDYYNTKEFYDLLNYTKLDNILYTIYLNWYNYKDKKKSNMIYFKYYCKPYELDKILNIFINNDYSISIFVINSIIKYFV